MDFMEISKKRVTVRKFAQTPVEDDKIQKILEAGRWSPTAVNAQPQRILVLNTPESLKKVRQFCSFGYDQKYVDLAEECNDKAQGKLNFMAPHLFCLLPMTKMPAGQIRKTAKPAERRTLRLWQPI
ncbi:MAG TPA: nitroreductase family protein [Candidatus Coprocola pullicola]|nr:nitroreductase family protein [Candidatus Coprocola pullicola]